MKIKYGHRQKRTGNIGTGAAATVGASAMRFAATA